MTPEQAAARHEALRRWRLHKTLDTYEAMDAAEQREFAAAAWDSFVDDCLRYYQGRARRILGQVEATQ